MKKRIGGMIAIFLSLMILSGNPSFSEMVQTKDGTRLTSVTCLEIEDYIFEMTGMEFPAESVVRDCLNSRQPIVTFEDASAFGYTLLAGFHSKGMFETFSLCSIIHAVDSDKWVFEYSIDDVQALVDCSVLYVIIQGYSGDIIAAWIEE